MRTARNNLYRLAGALTGSETETTPGLSEAARAAVEAYLLSREAEALWTLEYALVSDPSTSPCGSSCWPPYTVAGPVFEPVPEQQPKR